MNLLNRMALFSLCLVVSLSAFGGERTGVSSTPNRTASPSDSTTTRVADDYPDLLQEVDPEIVQSLLPHELEIQLFSGEFEAWSKAKTILQRGELTFRLAPANESASYYWELTDEPFFTGNVISSGAWTLPSSSSGPGTWHQHSIYPWGLPLTPPASPEKYYFRMVDSNGRASNPVVITYQEDDNETRFTDVGLNPFILKPLRVFADLSQFEIINADEGADEPYLINILIVLDGSTVDIFDLPNSSVRVLANPTTHDNIPQYNGNLTQGTKIAIPDETGRLITTMAPVNPELADLNLIGNYIYPDYLNRAATMVLVSIAMEEDAVSTGAISAMRAALLNALKARLNNTLRGTTLADLLPLLTQGDGEGEEFDPLSLVPRPGEEVCAYYENMGNKPPLFLDCRPGWQQMQDDIIDYAKKIAIDAELDTWNLFQIIASAVDPDDQIGTNFVVFNLEDIRNASQPFPIQLDFKKVVPSPIENVPPQIVHYRVTGSIGRCVDTNPDEACVPYYGGIVYNGVWVPGTGP